MSLLTIIFIGLAAGLVLQTIGYLWSRHKNRVDVVDVFWGITITIIVFALQVAQPTLNPTVIIAESLVVIWGLRLSHHIYRRFIKSSSVDKRYLELISCWPKGHLQIQIFTKIFGLQAVLATIVALPIIAIHDYQPTLQPIVMLGTVVWLIGFIFESVADTQLKNFLISGKHGELMTSGLWRYSRHPNYFGEIVMWWGIMLISFATPGWWLGIIGASLITYLICFVSGIPLAEKSTSQKAGWLEYKRQTSILIPLPKRSDRL